MSIDGSRLLGDLETLAGFGATTTGGVDRPSFSAADLAARQWLAAQGEQAGLHHRVDPAGNVWLRLDPEPGADAGGEPAVWTGSHLDTVPHGGRLDGALGVVAALEVLRALREARVPLRRPVQAVAFSDEEGAYLSFLGSRAAIEGLRVDDVEGLCGRDGDRLVDALATAGLAADELPAARIDPARVAAYVELHIEQGAVLEQRGVPLGVVTDIVGLARGEVVFDGRADHAGTTPLALRRDALRGAAGLLTELAGLPAAVGAPDAVITCGRLEVEPGADNVVPARVRLHLDVRDRDRGSLLALEAEVARRARQAADAHDLEVRVGWEPITDPVPLHPRLRALIAEVATDLGIEQHAMPSGAGHDAQVVARAVPTGMLFVPSIGGRSHTPEEATRPEDLVRGAQVLEQIVRRLATMPADQLPRN